MAWQPRLDLDPLSRSRARADREDWIASPASCGTVRARAVTKRRQARHWFPMVDTQRVSLPRMDLRLLRYFVAVAEERHFGRAAARLHMSQPPLSRAIKQLEADLGAVLLHRSATGVTLTAAGKLLYDEARALLEQADQARARVAAADGSTLTVGTIADSAEETGTRLAAAFRQQHPGVDVRIREADFTDPTAGVRAGLADVAVTRTCRPAAWSSPGTAPAPTP